MKINSPKHPWITFELDLRKPSFRMWLLLGEIASKCEHIASVPLKPAVSDRLHRVYLAKGVHATTAIEGNTLTESQVQEIIAEKAKSPISQLYQEAEIRNALASLNFMAKNALEGGSPFINVTEIMEANRLVLDGLDLEDGVIPGELRSHNVGVGSYGAPPWQEVTDLLSKMCDWLNGDDFVRKDELRTKFGILRAILAHLYFEWIHPFGDGNGRTGRALEYRVMLSAGVPSPAAHLLSNHYNQTRPQYIRHLELASSKQDGVLDFLMYALQGFLDGLKVQLEEIWSQQYDIAWKDFVYSHFGGSEKKTDSRQRTLLLALSGTSAPVSLSELTKLNPAVASLYAKVSEQTLIRDIADLLGERLIRKQDKGYVSNREIMLGFRPDRVTTPEA